MAEIEESATRMATVLQETYQTRGERAALRCSAGDAAALCDIIAAQILVEHKVKRGTGATMEGQRMALVAKRCGDQIWAMREKIGFEDSAS